MRRTERVRRPNKKYVDDDGEIPGLKKKKIINKKKPTSNNNLIISATKKQEVLETDKQVKIPNIKKTKKKSDDTQVIQQAENIKKTVRIQDEIVNDSDDSGEGSDDNNDDLKVIYSDKKKVQKKLETLYEPQDEINEKIKLGLQDMIKNHNDRGLEVPNVYKNGIFLLEARNISTREPKEVLLSKLQKGEYQTEDSQSDITKVKMIKMYVNKLPSFNKYKDVDNVTYLIKEHRLFISELLSYRKKQAPSTFKGDFTTLLRVIRLAYNSKSEPLYHKYSVIQRDIGDRLDNNDKENRLNEREEGQYLEWKYVLKERQDIENSYNAIIDKNTLGAYKKNQDLVLLSIYSLSPPLRREVYNFKFTEEKPREKKGDWVYFHDDGNVSLEIFEKKKRHYYISIPLTYRDEQNPSDISQEILRYQKILASILRQSYDTYKREYVFTNQNKYPNLSLHVKSVDTRLLKIFDKYGIKMGASTFRKSYISHEFSKYQHTEAEKEEIAKFMRTSVKYLNTNYNKILHKQFKNVRVSKENQESFEPIDQNDIMDDEIKQEDGEPRRDRHTTNIHESLYEKNRKRSKKYYDTLKEKETTYVNADGKTVNTNEARKKKLEQWRKNVVTDEDRKEYRKKRYIREYNNKYTQQDKETIREETLKRFGLTKYNDDGTIKDKL